jgi:hypothetical protein
MRSNSRTLRTITFATTIAGAAATLVACGSNTGGDSNTMPGMSHSPAASAPASPSGSSGHDMPGMDHDTYAGDGLAAQAGGFRFAPAATTLPTASPAGFRFRIIGPGGKSATKFEPDQTKLMHFYVVRSDLAGFQHVHPTMATDGTWTAPLAAPPPGRYRAYASFTATGPSGEPTPLVLSRPVTVPGPARARPLPAAAKTTTVDGYTLALSGRPMAGMEHTLTVTVRKNGRPVTDLQPYLDTFAHLTAFHHGDLAFAHLHPQGMTATGQGGPKLSFAAALPRPGNWRVFLQFQTGGRLHTAAITLPVTAM